MKHGSLFSGIGGFDLAAQWMGWENVFHCEWNEFGQKVLKHYWPNAVSLSDIHDVKFKKDERGNVWVRVAADTEGERTGEDIGGIRERIGRINDREGTNTNGQDKYQETEEWLNIGPVTIITGGFPCQPFSMAGKRKGTEDDRHLWPEMCRVIREVQPSFVVGENVPGLVNWDGGVVFEQVQADLEAEGYEVIPFILPACGVNAPHRRDRIWFVAYREIGDDKRNIRNKGKRSISKFRNGIKPTIHGGSSPHPDFNRHDAISTKEGQQHDGGREARRDPAPPVNGGIIADTDEIRRVLWNGQNRSKLSETHSTKSFYGTTSWENFPTQPPVCSRNDGISTKLSGITVSKHRNESIKAYGNAIVPNVAYQIFKAIEQFNTHHR